MKVYPAAASPESYSEAAPLETARQALAVQFFVVDDQD
jgi:hypothetical protein